VPLSTGGQEDTSRETLNGVKNNIQKIKEVKRRLKLIHTESAASSCLKCKWSTGSSWVAVFENLTSTRQRRSNSDFLKTGNGKNVVVALQAENLRPPNLPLYLLYTGYI
jgi:hypothetical protein